MDMDRLGESASAVCAGAKYRTRGKKKANHKTVTTDDKMLHSTLKRIGFDALPAIEEINIFKDDGVIQLTNPKVQASIAENAWVVSGSAQTMKWTVVLDGLLHLLDSSTIQELLDFGRHMDQVSGTVTDYASTTAQMLLDFSAVTGNASTTARKEDAVKVPELVMEVLQKRCKLLPNL